MMVQMFPAASFLILLFLPQKPCLPLERPRPATPWLLPVGWDQWPSLSEWEHEPPAVPLSGGGLFQGQRVPGRCQPVGSRLIPQRQRAQRSAPSGKRRDGRPNSLDLTFHLLREFLEMSREERLAQKARSNKILLHNIGK